MEIDLVYMWVDGSDPEWRARKNRFLPEDQRMEINIDAAGDCRYADNDELRYSLRSVERYAPWVRRIHIVTDDQVPEWLDTSHPKIHMVSHRDIMPAEILPTFNSTAIEYHIHKIEGLSEHFLFANDDTLFAEPVTPGFFFAGEGRPIVRLKDEHLKKHAKVSIYSHTILQMQGLVRKRFGRCTTLAPHHNVDAYTRTGFAECHADFPQLAPTPDKRFRSREDWQRIIISYYALATGRAVLRKVSRYNGARGLAERIGVMFGRGCQADSRCIPVNTRDYAAVMRKYRPSLFCMNDGEGTTDADRAHAKAFLSELLPDKSAFEK